jgi:hypothetical protein
MSHLVERHSAVRGIFSGKSGHTFSDHVAGHFINTAAEGDALARQVALSHFEQFMFVVDDTDGSGDLYRGVDLQAGHVGVKEPDDRPGGSFGLGGGCWLCLLDRLIAQHSGAQHFSG